MEIIFYKNLALVALLNKLSSNRLTPEDYQWIFSFPSNVHKENAGTPQISSLIHTLFLIHVSHLLSATSNLINSFGDNSTVLWKTNHVCIGRSRPGPQCLHWLEILKCTTQHCEHYSKHSKVTKKITQSNTFIDLFLFVPRK